MVSLNRLERVLQAQAAQGKPVNEMMHNLAGIYEIRFLTVLEETGDIVIAGPAGAWEVNDQGRPVNIENGQTCASAG